MSPALTATAKALLIAGLLFSSGSAYAQSAPVATQQAASPNKRDNVIILHTSDSTAAAYAKLGRLLLAEGYPIDKSDKDLGYINTGYRPTVSNRAVEASLRFSIVPNPGGALIEMRGICRMPGMGRASEESPIDFRGAFGSPIGIAWQEMNRVAEVYHAASLAYRHQL